jgi:hypothetical protein
VSGKSQCQGEIRSESGVTGESGMSIVNHGVIGRDRVKQRNPGGVTA